MSILSSRIQKLLASILRLLLCSLRFCLFNPKHVLLVRGSVQLRFYDRLPAGRAIWSFPAVVFGFVPDIIKNDKILFLKNYLKRPIASVYLPIQLITEVFVRFKSVGAWSWQVNIVLRSKTVALYPVSGVHRFLTLKFYTLEAMYILNTQRTVQNSVARATWHTGLCKPAPSVPNDNFIFIFHFDLCILSGFRFWNCYSLRVHIISDRTRIPLTDTCADAYRRQCVSLHVSLVSCNRLRSTNCRYWREHCHVDTINVLPCGTGKAG